MRNDLISSHGFKPLLTSKPRARSSLATSSHPNLWYKPFRLWAHPKSLMITIVWARGTRVLKVPKSFRIQKVVAKSKTLWLRKELFYLHILNTSRGSLHIRSFKRIDYSSLSFLPKLKIFQTLFVYFYGFTTNFSEKKSLPSSIPCNI